MIRQKNGDSKVVKATEKLEKLFAERERIEAEIRSIAKLERLVAQRESIEQEIISMLDGQFLTTKEVADRFRVSRVSVCNWVNHGNLSAITKVPGVGYLFSPESVNAFTPPPKGNPRHREMREQRGN